MELPVNLSMTGRLTASVSFSGKERAITVKVHPCITKLPGHGYFPDPYKKYRIFMYSALFNSGRKNNIKPGDVYKTQGEKQTGWKNYSFQSLEKPKEGH